MHVLAIDIAECSAVVLSINLQECVPIFFVCKVRISRYCCLGDIAKGTEGNFRSSVHSERIKRTSSGGSLQFSKGSSRKITVLFDFQQKFPDILAKW